MGLMCLLGLHKWNGCKCTACQKTRDEGHDWNGCKCTTCQKTRHKGHDWNGCKCTKCGVSAPIFGVIEHIWGNKTCDICGEVTPPGALWAKKLTQEENYQDLAAVLSSQDYKDSQEQSERKHFAKIALLNAGDKALDAVGKQLMSGKGNRDHLIDILFRTSSPRAVIPLMSVYSDVGSGNSIRTSKIVEFFARIGATEATSSLLPFLEDRNVYIRYSTAYGLGLLGVSETNNALWAALQKYPASIRDGLQEAKTEFAKSILIDFDRKRKASGPNLKIMNEKRILQILESFCTSLEKDAERDIEQLEPIVRDIGEELYNRGNETEMRRVLVQLHNRSAYRRIESIWSGIGNWQG